MRLSNLRRGRRVQFTAKRARLRRKQPRYAGNKLKSDFKQPPRRVQRERPYLPSTIDLVELLG